MDKRIINQMKDALRALDKQNMEILRSLKNPPLLVRTIGEAFCVVFNVLPSWENFLKLMNSPDFFIQRVFGYDLNSFPVESYERLNLYIRVKGFNPRRLADVSSSAPCLCKWLVSFHAYQQLRFEPK